MSFSAQFFVGATRKIRAVAGEWIRAPAWESGSSVRGRARISKVGNKKLRNLLFLCSFTACKHNKGCSEIYDRIVNKGKSKKLALIAVSNKLLKQCFAIAKSGHPYDPTFVSVFVVK